MKKGPIFTERLIIAILLLAFAIYLIVFHTWDNRTPSPSKWIGTVEHADNSVVERHPPIHNLPNTPETDSLIEKLIKAGLYYNMEYLWSAVVIESDTGLKDSINGN